MEEGPNPVLLVQHQLDKVVARPQGAKLPAPILIALVVELQPANLRCPCLQLLHPGPGGLFDRGIVASGGQGYLLLNGLSDFRQVLRQVGFAQVGSDGNHAAADVHANGGGDDGPVGGDAGADSGAQAEVAVGHDRYVLMDEGQGGDVAYLLPGGFLNLLRGNPAEGILFDHGRGHRFHLFSVGLPFCPVCCRDGCPDRWMISGRGYLYRDNRPDSIHPVPCCWDSGIIEVVCPDSGGLVCARGVRNYQPTQLFLPAGVRLSADMRPGLF